RSEVLLSIGRKGGARRRTVGVAAGILLVPLELDERAESTRFPESGDPSADFVELAGLILERTDICVVAVALAERPGRANGQRVAQRKVDRALTFDEVV